MLAVAGCGGKGKPAALGSTATATPSVTATVTAAASSTPTATPTATPAPAGPPPIPVRFRRAARKLPLAQRIGQLMVVGFEGTDLQGSVFPELAGHGWGGIVVGPDNAFDETGVGLFAGEARVVATNAGRVPPLVASFADGRPAHLGSSPASGRAAAKAAGLVAKAQGITLTTAPAIDVGLEADAKLIAQVAPAAARGWLAAGVAPAPSHFPGQGTVTQDPIDGPANVGLSKGELAGRDLRPFRSVLRVAPAVTISSASFTAYDPVTPAALTPGIVRGLLRGKLRFGGVAMTDDVESLSTATGGTPTAAAVDAIRAGIDLLYVPAPELRGPVYDTLLRYARKKALPRGRILQAVARVLQLKAAVR